MAYRSISLFLLLVVTAFSAVVTAEPIIGNVVRIVDGDTLVVLVNKKQTKVRLAQIDTPERGQPWASRAKQALSALAFGKVATVEPVTVDRYGRTVGEVFVDGLHVNRQLVRDGDVWVFRRYATNGSLFGLGERSTGSKTGAMGTA